MNTRALPHTLKTGLSLWVLSFTTAQAQNPESFVRIENGWVYFLVIFVLAVAAIAGGAYAYGKITRPGKANQYALTAATHLFIWVVILLTFYPVIYLVAVSLNKNDSITASLPKTGSILFRSGVLPDPSNFSFIQYQKLLGQTHLTDMQWVILAGLAGLLIGIFLLTVAIRLSTEAYGIERLRTTLGWLTFIAACVLIASIRSDQFYSYNEAGELVRASSEQKIILFIRNTLLVSGLAGVMAVLLSTTAGYAFARMRFDGRFSTLMTFVFVQMFPGFMALVAIYYLMNRLDLMNTFIGLILAYSGGAIAFGSWIFKGYLESINPSLEEAAMVDGATRWGAFWRVIMPVSIPMLLFIFLLQFIGTYSEFIMANTLLTGEDKWTVGMALRSFTTGRFNTQWGALAASAVLGSLPILIIFYSFQNALTGQYQAGGVKG